jgi:hypothetical protein
VAWAIGDAVSSASEWAQKTALTPVAYIQRPSQGRALAMGTRRGFVNATVAGVTQPPVTAAHNARAPGVRMARRGLAKLGVRNNNAVA